jgi:hypothetical protein
LLEQVKQNKEHEERLQVNFRANKKL